MSSWVAKIWQHIETKAKCFNDILCSSCPSNPTIASPPKSEIIRLHHRPRVAKHFETKAKGCEESRHLSWPCKPLIDASSPKSGIPLDNCPLQVPNLDRSLKHRPLSLKESTFYLLAPKQRENREWITRVEKVDPTTWRVLSPMVTIENLIRPIPSVVGVLDRPSNYYIKELAKSYILDDDNDPIESYYGFEEEEAQKVIPLYNQGDHLQLLALKWDGKLALWKPGHETWTDIFADNGDCVFEDIAAYNDQFYATDSNDGFYMIDGNKGRLITKTSDHAIFDSNTKGKEKVYTGSLSLVESDGQLCLFKLNYSQGNKVIMGHRKGDEHEQTWEWDCGR